MSPIKVPRRCHDPVVSTDCSADAKQGYSVNYRVCPSRRNCVMLALTKRRGCRCNVIHRLIVALFAAIKYVDVSYGSLPKAFRAPDSRCRLRRRPVKFQCWVTRAMSNASSRVSLNTLGSPRGAFYGAQPRTRHSARRSSRDPVWKCSQWMPAPGLGGAIMTQRCTNSCTAMATAFTPMPRGLF